MLSLWGPVLDLLLGSLAWPKPSPSSLPGVSMELAGIVT